MDIAFKIDINSAVGAESRIVIDQCLNAVFRFVAEDFHVNYEKWMPDVLELEYLNGVPVEKGHKIKQVRLENDEHITSVFEITEFRPYECLAFEGTDKEFRQIYSMESVSTNQTQLVFRFELLQLDLFMRPFEKLIRAAISEGVESTTLLLNQLLQSEPSVHH